MPRFVFIRVCSWLKLLCFFFFAEYVNDRIDFEVKFMSPTFEIVLKQAKALPVAERRKLVEMLNKPNGHKKRAKKWDDDPVIIALRAKVDEMEKSENLEPNSAAKVAERIRKWNDRGYKL